MVKKITDFLSSQRVGVLSVMLPDGSLHAAALHYSHRDDPLELYFSTENTSRKTQGLLGGEITKAAVVVGFSEEEWLTLQMDGEVRAVLDASELATVQEVHYGKHPGSAKYKDDPATIFLAFTPHWWRYTDYNTELMTILSS